MFTPLQVKAANAAYAKHAPLVKGGCCRPDYDPPTPKPLTIFDVLCITLVVFFFGAVFGAAVVFIATRLI